ncbi:uncharacterized protein LOC123322053 [Coccinella septempunctata]|uniref:uncharacterized protein LOC123322053 n=1 Tax=Coccinella septempunctata TaxID=41139 RepID=UPI001D06F36F|nr:uncharacterized protein LOC123322053 [Coccinella septempunctata]
MYRAALGFLCFCFLLHEYSAVPTTTTFPVATTDPSALITVPKSRYERGLEDYDESSNIQKRGMMEIHYDDHEESEKEQKAIQGDPWAGYYDFLINEGSFKFWAVFQLVTALILVYASFAAVYYAKFNVIAPDYSDDYDLLGRSYQKSSASSLWSGLSVQNFQRILDAISSKKYT